MYKRQAYNEADRRAARGNPDDLEKMKMDMNLVKQYAEFAVKIGVNPRPGQTLIIRAPIEGTFFARACAEAAYAAGAKEVVVHYSDEKLSRIKMENTAVEVLEDVKPWLQRSYLDYVESEGGACMLSISARDPEIYKGLDIDVYKRQALSVRYFRCRPIP